VSQYILLWMLVSFGRVRFRFSVLSQEIGWEECLRNDLFWVGWVGRNNSIKHCKLWVFSCPV